MNTKYLKKVVVDECFSFELYSVVLLFGQIVIITISTILNHIILK